MKKPLEEKISVSGPVGILQALLSVASDNGDAIAVICHPHSLHGGTMNNKVVHYTARALHDVGMPVLRFNFRGVGQSEGEFDNAVGEVEDLRAAVQWLQARYPGRLLILAGFSFGSYVAASAAGELQASRLISIAPPVNLYDFSVLENDMPWLVIQGDEDEVVPVGSVRRWLAVPSINRSVRWMPGASHFFHGRLPELANNIRDWLTNT